MKGYTLPQLNYAPVFGVIVQEQLALCSAHDTPPARWLIDANAEPPISQEVSRWVPTDAPCSECGR